MRKAILPVFSAAAIGEATEFISNAQSGWCDHSAKGVSRDRRHLPECHIREN